jgi:hypothetical protein
VKWNVFAKKSINTERQVELLKELEILPVNIAIVIYVH